MNAKRVIRRSQKRLPAGRQESILAKADTALAGFAEASEDTTTVKS